MISFKVDDISNMNAALKEFLDYLEGENVDDDAVFDSRLVSCELITNVLRHCGGTACFSGVLNESGVVISVCATRPAGEISIPSLPCVLAEGGRGLYIVNSVSGGNVVISGGKVTVTIKRKE